MEMFCMSIFFCCLSELCVCLAIGQASCYDDFTSNSRMFSLIFLKSGQSFKAFQPEDTQKFDEEI